MTCDFSVAVRIVSVDGSTVLFDFNDESAGVVVETLQEPDFDREKRRLTSDYVDGDYTASERYLAGDLIVNVRVEGATWVQCVTRWEAARAAYRAEPHYFVDVELEGVTKRYRTEHPDSVQGQEMTSSNLLLREQTYSIRWHVQPNPTVTIS